MAWITGVSQISNICLMMRTQRVVERKLYELCVKNDLIKLLIEHEVLNNLKSKILIEKLKGKGIAIPVGPCEKNDLIKLLLEHTPAVPHTVICPVQGSVGNSGSGLAVLDSPCIPVPEAAVDALL
jgi:hypothetical protein